MPIRIRHRRLWAAGALLVGFLVWDVLRPPAAQWTARAAVAAIHAYQYAGSPLVKRAGVRCRFTTSCSRYAEAAILKHGALVGTRRAVWRVMRCGPWTPAGTVDEP